MIRPSQYFYIWLLPLLWASCSLASYFYCPGVDYHLWLIGSIVGFWWVLFAQSVAELGAWWIPVLTAFCGALVMVFPGYGLDKCRLNFKVFAAVWWLPFLAVTTQLVMKNGSVQSAVEKQGSFLAFVCAGFNLSLLATALLAIAWLFVTMQIHEARERGASAADKRSND